MNATVQAGAFRDAVAWVARRVPSKPEMPTYAGIQLTAIEGAKELKLLAFDGDTAAEASMFAEIASGGRVAASGRLLAALAATLPARSSVEIVTSRRADTAAGTLTLTAGNVVVSLPIVSPVDRSFTTPKPAAIVDTDVLAAAVKRAAVAAAREEYAGDFTQVRLEFADGRFAAMAMETRRAACAYGAATLDADVAVTVTARVISEVIGTFGTEEISIGATDQLASFGGAGRLLVTRQWAKPFRTNIVTTALGYNPDGYAVVPTKPLADALKRAVLTRTEAEPTELRWAKGMLTVFATGATDATATATIDNVEYDGPEASLLVNPVLLGEALAAAGGASTRIAFEPTNPIRPLRITDPDDDDYVHVLVPIRPIYKPSGPYARK